jgi:hypothetical protein
MITSDIEKKTQNYQWWQPEQGTSDVWKRLIAWTREYDARYGSLAMQHMRHLRLYSNREVQKLTMAQHIMSTISDKPIANTSRTNQISLNVVKSCVDTLFNKIGKQKVKPMFLTSGGILSQKTKAQRLNQFGASALQSGNAYKQGVLALRDSFIFGDGFAKVVQNKDKKRMVERVMPDEIIVDPVDGYYGSPANFVHRRFVSREALIAMFPASENEIRRIGTATVSNVVGHTDAIVVAEGWHKGSPGRHVIVVDGATLLDEPWKAEEFPIRRICYTPAVCGYWSQGVAEELTGIQREINRLLLHVQESMYLLSNPRVWLEKGSQVLTSHITNRIGDIAYYIGQAPIIQAAQTVHPEIFAQIDSLYSRAFEIVGVSRLSAQSQKPPGLNSGVALDTYNDIETERFARTAQGWEEFTIDILNAIIDDIGDNDDYVISATSRENGIEKLRWKDVKLPKDDYLMQCYPTSAFPDSPAGKLSMINFMQDKGMIDNEEARMLLDFPDLDSSNRDKVSPVRLAFMIAEKALFENKAIIPDPYMDLTTIKRIARGMYSWANTVDIPDENMDTLRKVIDQCLAIEAQTTAKVQANAALPPTVAAMQMPMPQIPGMPTA